MPSLTVSGNEITDVIRALGTQGDGLANPDSSYGFFRDATNEMPNGGGETNTTNWTAVAAGVITTDATTFKFGAKSIKIVTPNVALGEGASADTNTGRAWAAGTWTCLSVWLKGSGTVTLTPRITNTDASTTNGTARNVTLSATYTRYYVFVQVAVGKTGDKGSLRILTDVKQGITINCDGCQIENESAGPDNNTTGLFKTPTPYIHTDGGTAQRRIALAQGLPSLPRPLQGWVAARVRFECDSTDLISHNPTVFGWQKSGASDKLTVQYLSGSAVWQLLSFGSSTSDSAFQSGSWVAGDSLTIVAYWTATQLGISINGGSFGLSDRTSTSIPSDGVYDPFTVGGTLAIGLTSVLTELNGQIRWFAMGAGTVNAADATALNALGNTDPTVSSFSDAAAVALVWPASTAAYTVPFTSPGPEFKTAVPIQVTIQRPGSNPVDLGERVKGLSFGTAAIGGFADASFTLSGDQRRLIPHLSTLRIMLEGQVLWEGLVEDISLSLSGGGNATTSVHAFGWQRLLTRKSVRRVWSKRDVNWRTPSVGATGRLGGIPAGAVIKNDDLTLTTGNYDPSDLNKSGIQVAGNAVAVPIFNGDMVLTQFDTTLPIVRVMADLTIAGAIGNWYGAVHLQQASQATLDFNTYSTSQSVNFAATSTDRVICRLGAMTNAAITPTAADLVQWSNIRILGTSLTEDASGGFYGSSILRDLIALVPGLTLGMIETGSDYTIRALESEVRSATMSVVDQVARYYSREWSVWEDGRFDWKSVDKDQPQWVTGLSELKSAELSTTVDGLASTVYILYADAAADFGSETSSTASAQRNPYVRTAQASDVLVSPGVSLNATDAAQLASQFVSETTAYPSVQGRITIAADRLLRRPAGPKQPATMIRAGQNIVVNDFAKTEPLATGRDGETLFHIVATECDVDSQTVTLTLEGQSSSSDVVLARLAASTQLRSAPPTTPQTPPSTGGGGGGSRETH